MLVLIAHLKLKYYYISIRKMKYFQIQSPLKEGMILTNSENNKHKKTSTNPGHFVKMILSKCLARQANLLRHTCDHHEYRFLI